MELRQSQSYARHLQARGWRVEKINTDQVFIRKIPLTPFAIIKFQRPKEINLKKLDIIAKKHRAITVYLEPNQASGLKGKKDFKPHASPFLPSQTIQIDLTQSKAKILGQMKKDARYAIRKAKTLKLQLIEVKDLIKFRQDWKKSVSWQRHVPSLKTLQSLKKAFGQDVAFLAVTDQNNQIIAGTIILMASQTAYYYHAFTNQKGRKQLAQYLLVWEAIKLAKGKKCQTFDFEGIYDPRFPIKAWQGFTHFKKSFGGQSIKYPGCFVKKYFF
jgi:lipid II:glycine glycyltransferase (peptidoglycan interpeptide bridge formation enzyme)